MYDRLVEAEELAQDLDDPKRLSTIKISQTLAFSFLGRLEEAMAAGTEGLSMAKDLGEPALVVAGCYTLAQANQWAGNFKSVIELLTPHRDLLTGPLRDQRIGTAGTTSVLWLGMLGAAHAYLGQFDKAQMDVEAARAIAGELERPYDQVMTEWYLGFALTHQGRAEEAVPVLERASEICKRAKVVFLVPVVATSLGYAYALLGRLDEATTVLDQAVGLSRKMGLSYGVAWSTCNLGFARLLKGEFEMAAGLAREAIELSVKQGHKAAEATARRLLAEALSGTAGSIPAQAEQEATRALEIAEGCDLRPEVAHCHLTLARIRSRVGDRDGARSHASRAEAIYHELDMASWVEAAEALSKA
jgi:tetratricopeptide (TPR) repeat protein